MGILNVTPDSFSDGGRFLSPDAALAHARHMSEEGADLIDVGGESTRPGSEGVSEQEELDRVIPVIQAICAELSVRVSIDTRKPRVMREAVAVGATMINDVSALRTEGALETAYALDVPVCLMHMLGEPRTMQTAPAYTDVVGEVREFLLERARLCESHGIGRHNILIDPGFGFGKTLAHNLRLLARLEALVDTGLPVLVGISRKSSLGKLLEHDGDGRLTGSVAAAVIAALKGAAVVRVHDVGPTRDALRLVHALQEASGL
jgi:dihydropteroate synthase